MIFTIDFESYQEYIMLSAVYIACIPQCRLPVMSIHRIQGESLLCHFISKISYVSYLSGFCSWYRCIVYFCKCFDFHCIIITCPSSLHCVERCVMWLCWLLSCCLAVAVVSKLHRMKFWSLLVLLVVCYSFIWWLSEVICYLLRHSHKIVEGDC